MSSRGFTFRFSSDGYQEIKKQLESIGPLGKAALDQLNQACPALRDNFRAASEAMDVTRKKMESVGGGGRLAAHEITNLSYQVQDAATQLAGGQSPFLILAQQGPQAVSAVGGVGRALALLTSPAGLAVSAVAAIGAGFALWGRHVESVRAVEVALRTMGNSLGATGDQMEAMAVSAADAGKVGVSSARSMQVEFVATGKIGAATMNGLIALTRDYAHVTGQDLATAAKELGGLMRDPAKGAAELAERFNLLSGAELSHIRRLADMGDRTQAQTALTAALGSRIKEAAEQTGFWGRNWNGLKNAADNALDAVGKKLDEAINGKSVPDQIVNLREAIAKAEKGGFSLFGGSVSPGMKAQIEDWQGAIEVLQELRREQSRGGAYSQATAEMREQSRVSDEITVKYSTLGEAIKNAEAEISKLSRGLGTGLTTDAAAGSLALEGLKNQLADLRQIPAGQTLDGYRAKLISDAEQRAATLVGPARERALAVERQRAELFGTATSAAQRQLATETALAGVDASLTQVLARQNAETSLQVQGALAVADAYRQSAAAGVVAEERTRALADALSTGVNVEERTRQLVTERAASQAASTAQAIQQMERETGWQQQITAATTQGAAARAEAERAMQSQRDTSVLVTLAQAAETEGAVALAAQLRALVPAYEAASRKASEAKEGDWLAQKRLEQTTALELARKEQGLILAAPGLRERELVKLRARQELQSHNISLESQAAQDYLAAIDTLTVVNQELERQKQAWAAVTDSLEHGFDRVGDAIVQAFVQGEGQAVDFKGVVKGIFASIASDLAKLALANPIKNAVFNTGAPTLSDLLSGSGRSASQNALPITVGGQAYVPANSGGGFSISNIPNIPGASNFSSGILSGVDQWGYSALGIGEMAAPATASEFGAMIAANPVGTSSLPITGGLGAGLSAGFGGGSLGGLAGGLIGTASNSKALGGLSGAALGAGGALAMGAMMGAPAGPFGIAAGAIIGGLMGMMGSSKKSVGPNWGVSTNTEGGRFAIGGAGGDNGGDASQGVQQVNALFGSLNTLVDSFGLRVNQWWGGLDDGHGGGETSIEGLFRKILRDGVLSSASPDVQTALGNSKATQPDQLAADLTFAKGFRTQLDALNRSLDPTANQLKTITEQASAFGTQVKTAITDWRQTALDLGLATDETLVPALRRGVETLFGLADATQAAPLRGIEVATETVKAQFEAVRPALEALGYTAAEQADLLNRATRQAVEAYNKSVFLADAKSRIQLQADLYGGVRASAADTLIGAGFDLTQQGGAQMLAIARAVLGTAGTEFLDNRFLPAASALDDATAALAGQFAAATTDAERLQVAQGQLSRLMQDGYLSADQYTGALKLLTDQMHSAAAVSDAQRRGQNTIAKTLDSAFRESGIDQVKDLGINPTLFPNLSAGLATVFDAATAGTVTADQMRTALARLDTNLGNGRLTVEAYNGAVSALAAAYQTSAQAAETQARAVVEAETAILRERLSALETEKQKVGQAKEAWSRLAESLGGYAKSLLLSEWSDLDPGGKVAAAKSQWRATLAQALAGDQTAAGQTQDIADAYLRASEEYWGSANPAAFQEVQAGVDRVSRSALSQLGVADRQLSELQSHTGLLQQQLDRLNAQKTPDEQAKATIRAILDSPAFSVGVDNLGRDLSQAQSNHPLLSMGEYQALGRLAGYAGDWGLGGNNAWRAANAAGAATQDKYIAWAELAARGLAFANGGIMTAGGPLPLHAYAAGGVADHPQLALFGEGRVPEAYVPLPDGRTIPVSFRLPSLPANDRGAPASAEVVQELRQQNRLLTALLSATASGARLVEGAVREGNLAQVDTAQAARRQAASRRSA
jgi:hypothetical protein